MTQQPVPRPPRRLILASGLVCAASPFGLSIAATGTPSRPPSSPPVQEVSTWPEGQRPASALFEAELRDLDGRPTRLPPTSRQPRIVNFWARWCGPCREEIPELAKLVKQKRGVDVIGIHLEADSAGVRAFGQTHGMNYPTFQAPPQALQLMRTLGNSQAGLPFTLFVSRSGHIVAHRMGILRPEHLAAGLQHLQG